MAAAMSDADRIELVLERSEVALVVRALAALNRQMRANGEREGEHRAVYVLACSLADRASACGTPISTGLAQLAPVRELELLDAGQVAELLGVSARRVRQLALRLGGRQVGGRWVFPAEMVDKHKRSAA